MVKRRAFEAQTVGATYDLGLQRCVGGLERLELRSRGGLDLLRRDGDRALHLLRAVPLGTRALPRAPRRRRFQPQLRELLLMARALLLQRGGGGGLLRDELLLQGRLRREGSSDAGPSL